MPFTTRNQKGEIHRYKKAVIDCSKDEVIVEQSHKSEVDINNIVKRHGLDLIQKVANLNSHEYRFDDVTGNDFQEAMLKITKAKHTFMALPSDIRKQFNNNAAEFLDFVQNPENAEKLNTMGLTNPPEPTPSPIEVVVTNPEPVSAPITETPA